METKKKGPLYSLVYSTGFDVCILILVILSIGMLLVEKIFDFTPPVLALLDLIDLVVLVVFTFEFVLKLALKRKEYFLGDYGWVDLLSILPILSPALKALRGIKLLRGTRLLRVVRLIKMIRLLRFLKFTKKADSVLKQKLFVPLSTAVMIIVLLVGFLFVTWQQGMYVKLNTALHTSIAREFARLPRKAVFEAYPAILLLKERGEVIMERIDEDYLDRFYLEEQLVRFTPAMLGVNGTGDIEIVASVKDSYSTVQRTELFIMVISVFIIVVLVLVLNRIVSTVVLSPLMRLSGIMDEIVYDVKIPNTNETRREINYDKHVDYSSNDEIGALAEKYDFLLQSLEEKNRQSRHIFCGLVASMMNLFGEFHNITRGHQVRTARIAAALGLTMGLPREQCRSLYFGMMLHDLGKVGVNKNVLTKPGRFTDDERAEMNRHPKIGYDIAKNFPLINMEELRIISEHHEKFDGSGYPLGLKGENLSRLSRIASTADIFDALSCPRDYKEAKSLEKVRSIMNEMKGTHLDPVVCKTLFDLVDRSIIIVQPSRDVKEEEWIIVDEKKLGHSLTFTE